MRQKPLAATAPGDATTRAEIQAVITASSMSEAARGLGVHRQTLASYMAGTARKLNTLWIERKAYDLGWVSVLAEVG